MVFVLPARQGSRLPFASCFWPGQSRVIEFKTVTAGSVKKKAVNILEIFTIFLLKYLFPVARTIAVSQKRRVTSNTKIFLRKEYKMQIYFEELRSSSRWNWCFTSSLLTASVKWPPEFPLRTVLVPTSWNLKTGMQLNLNSENKYVWIALYLIFRDDPIAV